MDQLIKAITNLHSCTAKHIGSEPVREVFKGQTVWDGQVEVFALTGHPKAKKCYGWSFEDDSGKMRHITVLEIPPVVSAQTAVKAAIASGEQK